MSWGHLREHIVLPDWVGDKSKWLMALGALMVVAIAGIFCFELSRRNELLKNQEEQEVQSIHKLLELQANIESVKSEISRRRVEGGRAGLGSRRDPYWRSSVDAEYIGFTPQNGFQEVIKNKAELYIPRGSVFKARTITSIKSSISESLVVAETTSPFEMDIKRRIPKGTRLIGTVRLNAILKGLNVRFDTMVLPSGKEIDGVRLLALDQSAFPELSGIFFSDKAERYGAALAFGFLSGFASAGQDRDTTILGSAPSSSIKNQTLAGVSTASFKVAEDLLRDIQDKAVEYVVLPAGEYIYVLFEEKLIVDPEKGLK